MGWCENTDTPHAIASAGARWHSAAGVRLFIPAEEPSCFFLCPPPHIVLKNRDAGFVSLLQGPRCLWRHWRRAGDAVGTAAGASRAAAGTA